LVDELPIEISEPEKDLDVVLGLRDRPGCHGLDFLGVHSYAMWADQVSQEGPFLDRELALLGLGIQTRLSELLQDHADMSPVFRGIFRVNQDIVEVDDHEIIEIFAQYIIHQVLEGRRSVAQTEGHNIVFEEAVARPERGLPLLSWSHPE